jgi:hypothetical protein
MATTPARLIEALELNYDIIQKLLRGLAHTDSLLQLPFHGNCANWVLGHIIEGRNSMLILLQEPPLWDEAACRIYRLGSPPITNDKMPHLSLECLFMDLKAMHTSLIEVLEQIEQTVLDGPSHLSDEPLGDSLLRSLWRETYHLGQFEIYRQLAGKEAVPIE